mgnify:CR=1 FL=1
MVKKLVTALKPKQWDRQKVTTLMFVFLTSLILLLKNSLIFTLSFGITYFFFRFCTKGVNSVTLKASSFLYPWGF